MSYDIDAVLTAAFEPLRALEPSHAEVQAVLRRAQRRRRRWTLRRRNGLAIALAALALGGGAAAALLDRDAEIDQQVRNSGPLASSGDPALDRLIALARTKPALAPIADTISVDARVPDPSGAEPWALVTWRSLTGGWCSLPARERDGRFGEIDSDGTFRRFPIESGGSCTTGPLAPDAAGPGMTSYPGGPTIVSGVAGRDVARVVISGVAGITELTPGARGGYLGVAQEESRHLAFHAELILRDGTHKRIGPNP